MSIATGSLVRRYIHGEYAGHAVHLAHVVGCYLDEDRPMLVLELAGNVLATDIAEDSVEVMYTPKRLHTTEPTFLSEIEVSSYRELAIGQRRQALLQAKAYAVWK